MGLKTILNYFVILLVAASSLCLTSCTPFEHEGKVRDLSSFSPEWPLSLGHDAGMVTTGPGPAFVFSGKLYIPDYYGGKILVWNSAPSSNSPADFALGAADLNNYTTSSTVTSATLNRWYPNVTASGTKMVVSDYSNNRVLIWNTIPTSANIPADVVLGQPDMTSSTQNNGGISSATLSIPGQSIIAGDKLFVLDYGNNRILIWNSIPTTNQQPADVVLGQPNMTSNTANNGGVSSGTLYYPWGLTVSSDNKFIVADYSNNRILIWNSIPTANQQPADVVLGQPDMTSNTSNNGGITAHSMSCPYSVATGGGKLYVADSCNNRVLIWNSIPTTNNQDADIVLGQVDMTSNANAPNDADKKNIGFPQGVFYDTNTSRLYISATGRVLVYTSAITTSNQAANFALGFEADEKMLTQPAGLTADANHFLVVDYTANRILMWNDMPSSLNLKADLVLGQNSIFSSGASTTAQSLAYPGYINLSNNKLFVSDTGNSRILIYNSVPTSTGQAPNIVLGQPNMTSGTANNGGISSATLSTTGAVFSDGTRLVAADMGNNRVLIWNTIPTSNQQPADVVLGQPNMTSNTPNNGGISSGTMYYPLGVFIKNNKLFVADFFNSRVLIWNSIPTTNGQPADIVLGQPNMTSSTPNNGGISATSFMYPGDIFVTDDLKLLICDRFNNRVLIWNSIPTSSQTAADSVIGQETFSTNDAGIGPNRLSYPAGVLVWQDKIWISDLYNSRVLVREFE